MQLHRTGYYSAVIRRHIRPPVKAYTDDATGKEITASFTVYSKTILHTASVHASLLDVQKLSAKSEALLHIAATENTIDTLQMRKLSY